MVSNQFSPMLCFQSVIALIFLIAGTTGFVVSSPVHVPETRPQGCQRAPVSGQKLSRWRIASTDGPKESIMVVDRSDAEIEEQEKEKKKNEIVVSSEITLPFKAELAFDSFSNLENQASWSPWLRSVEYTTADQSQTRWKMKRFLGVSYSWTATTRRLQRPNLIEWESTQGLKNYGRVDFVEVGENKTIMKLSLSFVVPRVVSKLVGKNNRIAKFVKLRMVGRSLKLFRDIVMEAEGMVKVQETSIGEEEVEDLETVEL